ncbi:tyrosine-type recombinase/integrase [Pseudomonas sp. MAG002Y]|uniref:tyrosine-type recombinase/integrase n=1 Tax=Pseudomonas sp. MAG002Y TaxID=2678690 RepID=UPI001C60E7BF|nr:tyrosine-type recombinase/integrase [Pseudomonas sp. MAG002Y]MBW5415076.1 tyrosine-type recombinase/integrase [Pseudomonas sp. MAG002Y]
MRTKVITGLSQRNRIWHIDKKVDGIRLYESTRVSDRQEAERYLIHRLEQLRQQKVYRIRQVRLWEEAAAQFIKEFEDQPSIQLTVQYLKQLHPLHCLNNIDDEALEPFIKHKLEVDGVSARTVNIALERVIRILNLCARKWQDEEKRPWLDAVPMIKKQDEAKAARKPYPLSWEEQSILFAELPDHLRRMALYKVNTGCREQEVCKLRWEWEIKVPEIGTSVFLIPAGFGGRHEKAGVKNGDERLVVLNSVAMSVIDEQRGLHPGWVFPYGVSDGQGPTAVHRMNDSAWKKARVRAADKWEQIHKTSAHPGFRSIRVHDLKHSFGRRLRAAGVTEEDRKALLGHKNGSITSHYSGAELGQLIDAANKVSATDSRGPVLTILKRKQA